MNATTLSGKPVDRDVAPARPFASVALELLVGPAGRQRVHTAVAIMGVLVYAVFALVQAFEVAHGLIDRRQSDLLSAFDLAGGLVFYAVLRSGLYRHVKADPALAFTQCVFALTSTSLSYAITGPARGAVLGIVLIILVFAMFSLPVAQIRTLSVITFGSLGTVMWWCARTSPDPAAPAVEATHAMFAAIIIASTAVLSTRMAALRGRLARQRSELTRALELNRRLATIDALTGLVNRRHMTVMLEAEVERNGRHPGPMSIAVIDIDLFKRVNDDYGHATGDAVLQRFAQLAMEQLRTCDVVARWGGEEFLVLLPDVDRAAATQAIDRLRVAFARLDWPQTVDLRPTFSAGVAARHVDESVEALVDRADQCMYAAKSAGRNRVSDATPGATGRAGVGETTCCASVG